MSEIPADRTIEMPAGPRWPVLVGLGLPLVLVLLCALAVPRDIAGFLGISLASWCLFACAPATSLCLAICWRFGSGGVDSNHASED